MSARATLVLSLLSLSWIGLGACGPSEDDFPQSMGDVYCHRLKECDQGSFENQFSDMSDCEDQAGDVMDWALGFSSGCDYDAGEARKCLHAMRSASCGDFESFDMGGDCDNVYACGS